MYNKNKIFFKNRLINKTKIFFKNIKNCLINKTNV